MPSEPVHCYLRKQTCCNYWKICILYPLQLTQRRSSRSIFFSRNRRGRLVILSKQARSLSKKRIHRLTDDEAFAEFCAVRFAENGGEPFCPWCGHKEVYSISTRKKWRCKSKACQRDFSATPQTVFASRKLEFRDLLLLIAHQSKVAKNINAIQMSAELEVEYKTAFVWCHKIREAIGAEQHRHDLRGDVEIDGAYYGGHVRPKNEQTLRVDRRKKTYQSDKRQCVVIMRERHGKSRAFVCSEAEGARLVPKIVLSGSRIIADGDPAYNRLHGSYEMLRVDHNKRFSEGDACTNWAESYFSRLDRAEYGVHHRIAGPYLGDYANEISWREDRRRCPANENYEELLRIATHYPVSRRWKGYWQRRKEVA